MRRRRAWLRGYGGGWRAFLRRLIRGTTEAGATPCPLSRLPVGATAQVVAIRPTRPGRLERLSTLGIVPGSQVRVEQRWPSLVVRLDETELSLDEDIAEHIIVRIQPTSR